MKTFLPSHAEKSAHNDTTSRNRWCGGEWYGESTQPSPRIEYEWHVKSDESIRLPSHVEFERYGYPSTQQAFEKYLFVDLAEAFAGKARITREARARGLTAFDPADIIYNWDLSSTKGAQEWKEMITREKPLVIIIGFSCTNWTSWSRINYAHRPIELEEKRARDRKMLELMVWSMRQQAAGGRYFLFENPPTSDVWKDEAFQSVNVIPNLRWTICDACAYGKRNIAGTLPLWERHDWMTNHWHLERAVCRRCPGHAEHAAVAGEETKPSGEYTADLSKSIVDAIEKIKSEQSECSPTSYLADDPSSRNSEKTVGFFSHTFSCAFVVWKHAQEVLQEE